LSQSRQAINVLVHAESSNDKHCIVDLVCESHFGGRSDVLYDLLAASNVKVSRG